MVRVEDTTEKAGPQFEAQAAAHRDSVLPGPAAERGPVGALNLYARAASAYRGG